MRPAAFGGVLLLALSAAAAAQAPRGMQLINLGCVDALAAVGEADLAGVFSFIPEKDAPAAFADLLVHKKKAMKKFLDKMERDRKDASGVSIWDHQALQFALAIYASPLAETLAKPASGVLERMNQLVAAPTMSLEQMTARRRR